MGYGETPPPLPIKSGMGDYGNLMENPELASPTTPPPPPLHHRVKPLSIHRHPHTFLAVNGAIICNSEPTQDFILFSKMVIGSASLTRSDTKYPHDLYLLVNWLENSPVHSPSCIWGIARWWMNIRIAAWFSFIAMRCWLAFNVSVLLDFFSSLIWSVHQSFLALLSSTLSFTPLSIHYPLVVMTL